jgi:C4-dicarboxylate transporter, DctM subunit
MSLMQVSRAALPWLSVLLLFLVMVTYIPQITLALPNAIFGP